MKDYFISLKRQAALTAGLEAIKEGAGTGAGGEILGKFNELVRAHTAQVCDSLRAFLDADGQADKVGAIALFGPGLIRITCAEDVAERLRKVWKKDIEGITEADLSQRVGWPDSKPGPDNPRPL